jgi:hypothetical protein
VFVEPNTCFDTSTMKRIGEETTDELGYERGGYDYSLA